MNGHTIIKAGHQMGQVSRQRRWQIQQQAKGNCENCGAAREGASNSFCEHCHGKKKTYSVSEKRKAMRRVAPRQTLHYEMCDDGQEDASL